MLNARFRIPTLHCTSQFDETGTSQPYLWFAYFWLDFPSYAVDHHHPVSVYVPPVADSRSYLPDPVRNNQSVSIPAVLGQFEVNLEGGHDIIVAMAGVLIVLLEEDETPDEAVAAGYAAFGSAVRRELNRYVSDFGLVKPDDEQIKTIADAIERSVRDAIVSKLDFASTWFDDQDDYIGYTYAILTGGELAEPQAPRVVSLNLKPIDKPVTTLAPFLPPPFGSKEITIGLNHYEFVRPHMTLRQIAGPCADEMKAFEKAAAKSKALRGRLRKVKERLARASKKEKLSLGSDIEDLRRNQIPAADKATEVARRGLETCHFRAGRGGPFR